MQLLNLRHPSPFFFLNQLKTEPQFKIKNNSYRCDCREESVMSSRSTIFFQIVLTVSSGSLDVSPYADEAGEPSYTK